VFTATIIAVQAKIQIPSNLWVLCLKATAEDFYDLRIVERKV
jgi:hypothetical protein